MKKKELSKRVQVYLPLSAAEVVEREAKAERVTLSTYCSVIICDAVNALNESEPLPEEESEDEANEAVHVHLYGKDAAILKRKASQLGLTPTEWFRNAVLRKDLSIYQVQLGDLEDYLDKYGRHVSAIEGTVEVCKRNNSVFKQDLELILERQEIIRNLMLMHLSALLRKREKAQLKLIKKNEEA